MLFFFLLQQEFCLFATIGLLSDFFLQISFFATVLSIDIQRLEVKQAYYVIKYYTSSLFITF